MLTAALLAIPLKKNLPVALLTTLYTNPFTIVPLYLLAYGYGRLLLGLSHEQPKIQPFEMDWAHLIDSMGRLFDWTLALGKPLAVGLVALALTLAALGYVAVRLVARLRVLAWRRRQRRGDDAREFVAACAVAARGCAWTKSARNSCPRGSCCPSCCCR